MHKVFGLVGFPLGHSFSARWFAQKFSAVGYEGYEYRLFEIPSADRIRPTLENISDLGGFNVTIPHKQAVIAALDVLSDEARDIGAVNCVSISAQGLWTGHNTDAPAFRKTLLPFLTHGHDRAVVLGNGGAAAAVRYVLRSLGIAVTTVTRQPSPETVTYNQVSPEWLRRCKLVVNTTPVGQFPNTGDAPDIPLGAIGPEHLVYDLVYNPAQTPLLAAAAAQGATVLNGLEMLYLQAELGWQRWSAPPA